MNEFERRAVQTLGGPLRARALDTLQVNVGLRCNQTCSHCHVGSSPDRGEIMARETLEQILAAAGAHSLVLVDVTGGAPELHPDFRWFVDALARAGVPVQVRTNLTTLTDPDHAGLPSFFRERRVTLLASLPGFVEEAVALQRGADVFAKSLEALRGLNAVGYGREEALPLNLAVNPVGANLPDDQSATEALFRTELAARHGVAFTRLFTLANVPVGRFRQALRASGEDGPYRALLREAFNPATLGALLCRRQVEVGWDGRFYDCDYNLAAGLAADPEAPGRVADFDAAVLARRRIVTGEHCFACTAGSGSS